MLGVSQKIIIYNIMCIFGKKKAPKKVVEQTVTLVVEDSYYNPYKCGNVDVYVWEEEIKPKAKNKIKSKTSYYCPWSCDSFTVYSI